MRLGASLLELGGFLEECERRQGVTSVETVECIDASDPARTNTTVELTTRVGDSGGSAAFSLSSTEIDGDGRIRLGFESADAILPQSDYDVRADVTGATVNDDGTVTLTLSVSMTGGERSWTDVGEPADDGGSEDGATIGRRDREVPPFEDTELLASVYESCDTFAEMAEEIEMDVTAETVRRYMVDHDIHEPNSYDTESDDDEGEADAWDDTTVDASAKAIGAGMDEDQDGRDEPVVLADGIGLPDDVTVETLIETVRRSNTIYEFKRDVGIERDRALDVLRELNLLDFFAGRLDSDVEREIRREEVIERLRQASACQ